MKLAGIILIIAGVAALIYGGITFTTHKKEIDMGPLQVSRSSHHQVPLPPILGVAFILGGGFLAYSGSKSGN
jgi:hypothetical protein